jgi:cyanophycinase-like exopeptidase
MDSILTSIKKLISIEEEDTHFDTDICMHINMAFATLHQIGAGPALGFSISDATAAWTDFTTDIIVLGFVKSYIYLKVKLIFDPPQSSAAIESINVMIAQFEWRLQVQTDPPYVPLPDPADDDENWADG